MTTSFPALNNRESGPIILPPPTIISKNCNKHCDQSKYDRSAEYENGNEAIAHSLSFLLFYREPISNPLRADILNLLASGHAEDFESPMNVAIHLDHHPRRLRLF